MPDHDDQNQEETAEENETISHRPLTSEEVAEELEQADVEYIMNRDLMFADEKVPVP